MLFNKESADALNPYFIQLVETNDIDTVSKKATDELIGRAKHRKVDGLPQEVEKACEEKVEESRGKSRLAMLKKW